jgi:hypothetical protein
VLSPSLTFSPAACQSQGFFFLKPAGTACNAGFNTCNNRGCRQPLDPTASICEVTFTLVAADAVATFTLSPTQTEVDVPVIPGPATMAAQVKDCSGNVVLVTSPVDVDIHPDRQSVLLLASNDDLASLAVADGLAVEDLLLSLVIEPTTVRIHFLSLSAVVSFVSCSQLLSALSSAGEVTVSVLAGQLQREFQHDRHPQPN